MSISAALFAYIYTFFLKSKLEPGDDLMADRGFDIEDDLPTGVERSEDDLAVFASYANIFVFKDCENNQFNYLTSHSVFLFVSKNIEACLSLHKIQNSDLPTPT